MVGYIARHAKPAGGPDEPLAGSIAGAVPRSPLPMPELPEVETTRRGVAPHVVGRRIARVVIYDGRLRWPVPQSLGAKLKDRMIDAVDRRSKYLLFRIGDGALLVHLGMTGSLRLHRDPPPRRIHDHIDIELDDGALLRYHDPRRFGTMLWVTVAAGGRLRSGVGPETFAAASLVGYLLAGTRGWRASIKVTPVDNHVVDGVGYICANEALFRAGVRPSLPAGRLSRRRIQRLVDV